MKMSDAFELPVTAYTSRVKLNVGFSVSCINIECAHGRDCDGEKHAHSAAHAINNHDRMVGEIAELKLSEIELVNKNEDLLCMIDDLTRVARALNEPERHTHSQYKRAKRDLDKLLSKLNQEGEE